MTDRILADIPQVVKQSSDGSGNQTPKFLSLSPNIQIAECRYVLKSISSVLLKQLSIYEERQVQHLYGSSTCPVVIWVREESKSKCPCLANFTRPVPPACCPLAGQRTKPSMPRTLASDEDRVLSVSMWPVVFHRFRRTKKDLDDFAHQLNNKTSPSLW